MSYSLCNFISDLTKINLLNQLQIPQKCFAKQFDSGYKIRVRVKSESNEPHSLFFFAHPHSVSSTVSFFYLIELWDGETDEQKKTGQSAY